MRNRPRSYIYMLGLFLVLGVSGCLPKEEDGSQVKIVNGLSVKAGDPLLEYTAALITDDGRFFCSAVLVAPDTLITAAHCLKDQFRNLGVTVSFGPTSGRGPFYKVRKYYQHQGYSPAMGELGFAQNDIGRPVPMADETVVIFPYSTKFTIAGFGITGTNARDAGILRYTDTFVAVDDAFTKEIVVDSLTIANACDGDSGGPAVIEYRGLTLLLGTASYVLKTGKSGCESGLAAYADVRKYRSWILDQIATETRR
jgi:secreted trypsin-like serine protease